MNLTNKYKDEAAGLEQPDVFAGTRSVAWRSPSNIALVKYWGKKPGQVPENPSLSFSLDRSYTDTKIEYTVRKHKSAGLKFLFEGKENPAFEKRVKEYLQSITPYLPFLDHLDLTISSSNSFPHSSGIASSASAMSALALCLTDMEKELFQFSGTPEDFKQKAAFLARLGSGSATRSVYGGYVLWGETAQLENSTDEAGLPWPVEENNAFSGLNDSILITSAAKKKISSSRGHGMMKSHPWAGARYVQANQNLEELLEAINTADDEKFIAIIENEALSLHALMMSSDPGYRLMNERTWAIIDRIREYREKTGQFITFTLDAGPNVHVFYRNENKESITAFIKENLLKYCENAYWIDDQMGNGPMRLI